MTTTPVELDQDWRRFPKAGQTLFGLSRPYLYRLWHAGHIRTVSLRAPQNKIGVRYLYVPSLTAYFAKMDEEQNGSAPARNSDPRENLDSDPRRA